ncbi:UBA domain-containing protein RUP1 [Candida viswanathii]|uniref:UBA domain-containing protein RUP1 n=1 Tax=Candida viswanathii TaxID=5486 RepID=A0A367XQR9_9ASCO|nr:UBA domain-containing protein RUP1 [Candida viswanathii]
MTNDKIKQLKEMGFTEEQATDALKASNNDLQLAIGHLFGDPISQPPPATVENKENTQIVPYSDTIQVTNPQDIPDFTLLGDNSSSTAEWGDFQQDSLPGAYEQTQTNSRSREVANDGDDDDDDDDYDDYDDYSTNNRHIDSRNSEPIETLYDIPLSFAREPDVSPAVLPRATATLQSCLLSLLVSLSQITEFKQVYLSKDLNYGFHENWFNPNTELEIEVPEEYEDQKLYRFVVEVQRILGFLTAASKRAFISGENLYKSLPEDFVSDEDEWEDVIKKFYAHLATGAKAILGQDLSPFFLVEVECNDEERTDLSILQIDFEARGTSLQEGFNSLFWSSDLNPVFTKIGSLLTVQVFGDEDSYQTQPFEVPEFFYPGLYGKDYQSLIKKMDRKKLSSHKERSGITGRLMEFSSFEGKKIKKILQNSIDYFATTDEREAHDDLLKLTEKIKSESVILNERLKALSQEYLKMDTTKPENILEVIEKEELLVPEKYVLTGVILSDSEYIYRANDLTTTDEEEWLCILIDQAYDRVLNFRSEAMSFDAVQSFVLEETKLNNKQLVLFYTAESALKGTAKLPKKLAEFFDKDNHLVVKQTQEAKTDEIADDEERESQDIVVDDESQSIELKGEDLIATD